MNKKLSKIHITFLEKQIKEKEDKIKEDKELIELIRRNITTN